MPLKLGENVTTTDKASDIPILGVLGHNNYEISYASETAASIEGYCHRHTAYMMSRLGSSSVVLRHLFGNLHSRWHRTRV